MTRFAVLSWLLLACTTACSDYFGAGPDPGKAGISEGKRIAIIVQNLYPSGIAVDETRIYVLVGDGVVSFAKNGTDRQRVSTYSQNQGVMVQWNEDLFVRPSNGGIVVIPKSGGDAVPFVPSNMVQGSGPIAVDDTGVYFVSGPGLFRAPFPAGAPVQLANDATSQGGPQGNTVAVDANNVYYVGMVMNPSGPNSSALRTVSKADGTASVLATTTGGISGVVAANGHVYYLDSAGGNTGGGKLISVDPNNPAAVVTLDDTIISNGGSAVMVADETGVYLSTGNGVFRAALDGSGLTAVVQNTYPMSMALDETWIYWADQNSNGALFKIRK